MVEVVLRVVKMSMLGMGRALWAARGSVSRKRPRTFEREDERSVTMGKRVVREVSGCVIEFSVNPAFG